MPRPLRRVSLAALLCLLASAQQPQPTYRDPAAPIEKRVADLVSRMTVEEKVAQMMNDAPAIDRLGIPTYNWWNECLHGVARAGRATVFPQAIGLAATWDTDLIHRVANTISDEARAKFHEAIRRDKHGIYQGLTFWTPNINLFRDPRWGRGMETYGEDPFLTGSMAVQFIRGIQGDDPKYWKAVATAKHYAVHSGPESLRHTFDAAIDDRDLRDTYLPQFEAAIKQGSAASVMCAYNRVDGLPACASPKLLDEILRKEWGFSGYVVSDCGAIGDIYLNHKTAPNAQAGVASAIKAGTDLNCGVEYTNAVGAVKAGLLSEADLDQALKRLFYARFKLGLFDPPSMVKYAQIPYSENDSPAHRQLALETARKSIVLLKNEGRALPLSKSLKTIAVIGPNADDVETLLANYNGDATAPVTPLAGIRRKLGTKTKVLYARGAPLAANMPAFEAIPSTSLQTPDGKPGLKAEYFATSNFDGKRHQPRELTYPNSGQLVGDVPPNPVPAFTRVDTVVDFNWWEGAPGKPLEHDNFGVRWTGFLVPKVSGKYQVGVFGMSAFELYLDGKQVAAQNNIHESSHRYAPADLEAGKRYAIRLEFHEYLGEARLRLEWSQPRADETEPALAAARQADVTVIVLGLSPRLEGEEMSVPVEGFKGGDRVTLGIPQIQEDLMQKVVALGKPVVAVFMNGSAISINWARDHVPGIIEAWYPGQAGGDAIADVLFGDYNPAGRLPVTFYESADQLPAFTDYNMKGRTYRYFEGEPLFPFGYGLSYTSFAYRNLQLPSAMQAGSDLKFTVEMENTGPVAGEEVVQVYVKGAAGGPIRTLAAFRRIALKPHEKRVVDLTIAGRQTTGLTGDVTISAGGKQPGFRGALDAATTAVVEGRTHVR